MNDLIFETTSTPHDAGSQPVTLISDNEIVAAFLTNVTQIQVFLTVVIAVYRR
jgi:hypothetical protein